MGITQHKLLGLQKRKPRTDSWTKEKRSIFLEKLATTSNATAAARAAGKSLSGAYQLRGRDPEFAALWALASEMASIRLGEELVALQLRHFTSGDNPDEVRGDGPVGPIDVDKALKVLHARADASKPTRHNKPSAVTPEQVEAVLAKRLHALHTRRGKR